ncbi:hypothetical protein HMPREF9440_00171 [Sutterella parvirubra YIT 11816]|uniref:Uncharacterized protein n=1 Tax=Sutterella parvirubra YIT 11816 TaxID=762967 RepID=H3KBS5_9BURK|nr:hypothetical protein HMPREF9440_00171 [Sutterella parvirubra YIT 11816]
MARKFALGGPPSARRRRHEGVRKPKAAPRAQRRRRRGRRPESWEGNAPKKILGIFPGFGLRSAAAETPPERTRAPIRPKPRGGPSRARGRPTWVRAAGASTCAQRGLRRR